MRTTIALAACALTACATTPVPTSDSKPIPPLDASYQAGTPVTIKRDAGLVGAACAIRVFVDGKPAADLRARERVQLRIAPGEHVFSVKPNGLCGGGLREVARDVPADGAIAFRIGYGGAGDLSINPTSF